MLVDSDDIQNTLAPICTLQMEPKLKKAGRRRSPCMIVTMVLECVHDVEAGRADADADVVAVVVAVAHDDAAAEKCCRWLKIPLLMRWDAIVEKTRGDGSNYRCGH